MKRLITERQEQIYRMRHHDFGFCWASKEVAKELELSEATISNELAKVRKVAPQLFPILTELEAECCSCYIDEGMLQAEVAIYLTSFKYLGLVTKNAVALAISRAKAKGFYILPKRLRGPGKILSYDELQEWYINIKNGETTDDNWLDFHIKQKF